MSIYNSTYICIYRYLRNIRFELSYYIYFLISDFRLQMTIYFQLNMLDRVSLNWMKLNSYKLDEKAIDLFPFFLCSRKT